MKTIGLYLHIPFCRSLCHYCDFVKTANWNEALVHDYFKALRKHLSHWITEFIEPKGYRFKTVFIGGGTPSLFTKEYDKIFALLKPYLTPAAEITMEANPDNLKDSSLAYWKKLGVNRLSVGIQSFCGSGLKFLTREHSLQQAIQNFERAQKVFENINIDLIYGWGSQDKVLWKKELSSLVSLDARHISLYLLTYAQKTPIGRAYARGKITSPSDQALEDLYLLAKKTLSEAGYSHEEVSNWSKESYSCEHNWLYWQDQYYLAVGAGACGYLPSDKSSFGMRYRYTSNERSFCTQDLPKPWLVNDFREEFKEKHFLVEERSGSIWLLEYIGASLRHSKGVSLERVQQKTSYSFKATPAVEKALKDGLLSFSAEGLTLVENEWFRESSWCLLVYDCFVQSEEKE